jgi:hypothetical protein
MKIVYLFLFLLKHAISYLAQMKAVLEENVLLPKGYYLIAPPHHPTGLNSLLPLGIKRLIGYKVALGKG